jgi:hypothetical protein
MLHDVARLLPGAEGVTNQCGSIVEILARRRHNRCL